MGKLSRFILLFCNDDSADECVNDAEKKQPQSKVVNNDTDSGSDPHADED